MTHERVAVITGCGKDNLGTAVAREAVRRGFSVVMGYRNAAEEVTSVRNELRASGGHVEAVRVDVSVDTDIEELIAQAVNAFGRIDLLATCASLWSPTPFDEISTEDLSSNFAVNTLGTFLAAQKAGAVMAAQSEGGAIVTFGDWAIVRPYIDFAAYSISKGAIPTLTAVLANELARKNPRIRVNCIHPGVLNAPHPPTGELRDKVIHRTPAQRLGDQANIVQTVFFLAENDYISGACIPVDGGRTISTR
ncbi:MAG: SDR family oxidoreductase [Bdellovibrionota bacterium]